MSKMDTKFLAKAMDSIIEFKLPSDPYSFYGFSKRLNTLSSTIKKYANKGNLTRGSLFRFNKEDDYGFSWIDLDGKEIIVQDRFKLNYQAEYDCFSQQITNNPVKIKESSEEQILKAISENHWQFAKTAVKNPHFYAVKWKWNSRTVSWFEFLHYIIKNSRVEYFWQRRYLICQIDQYKYWSMGNAENITIIINRAELNE